MPTYDPDLIGYSGRRKLLNFDGSTVDDIITRLATTLAAAAWTQLDSGTLTGHPYYDMLSAQSPYWDPPPATPPASYQAKVRVLIHSDNSNTVKIKPSNFDGSLTLDPAHQELQIAKDAASRRIIACPYQFVTYVPGVLTSPLGPLAAIVSAPHTPKFFQLNLALEECIVAFDANNFRTDLVQGSGAQGQFFCVKHSAGTFKWSGPSNNEGNLRFLTPVGGRSLFNFNYDSGYFVYNKPDDPNMLDVRTWYGLLVPPAMEWGRSSGAAGPLFNFAWLWDCLLASQAYSGDVSFTFDGHTFANFQDGNVGGVGGTFRAPGTLLFAHTPETD